MTDSNDTKPALETARGLARAGVPVFVAYPDPSELTGYRLPKGWQTTRAEPRYVNAWRPGRALCAVMGHGLDLVDVDPRNGGDVAALDGLLPKAYAIASTPSGGTHFFIKSLGLRSRDAILPGIDLKAGDADGNGRGFAFIAPTVRVSKTTGELVEYRWIQPPDLDGIEDDDSGDRLAAHVRSLRDSHEGEGERLDYEPILEGVPEGERDDTLWRFACSLRARGIPQGWAEQMALAAAANCTPPFDTAEARRKVERAYGQYEAGGGAVMIGSGGFAERTAPKVRLEPDAKPSRPVVIYSAAQLEEMTLPEPRHAVPGLMPEGLLLVTGKPKVKKSWMLLNIGVALATGGKVLGKIDVEPAEVLYLALEDGPRRLRERLGIVLGGRAFPARLHFATDWPRFHDGGIEALDAWLTAHPDAKLVAIDTFAKVRPPRVRNADPYAEDYEHAGAIKTLADKHHVCIAVVHHLRKAESDDPLDLVSGTLALVGAADSIFVLKKASPAPGIDAQLHIRGRDFEDEDLALAWWNDRATWEIAGDWEEASATGHRASVRAKLADGPLTLKELETETGIEYRTLDKTVRRLVRNGELKKEGRGLYSLIKGFVRNVRNESENSDTGESDVRNGFGHSDNSDRVVSRPFEPSDPHPCDDCGEPITGSGPRCFDCAAKASAAWKAAQR